MAAPTPSTACLQHKPLMDRIAQLDRHGYLFGQKLAASMSPALHQVVYRELGLKWDQIRLDTADIDLFLRLIQHPDFYGSFVSIFINYP